MLKDIPRALDFYRTLENCISFERQAPLLGFLMIIGLLIKLSIGAFYFLRFSSSPNLVNASNFSANEIVLDRSGNFIPFLMAESFPPS